MSAPFDCPPTSAAPPEEQATAASDEASPHALRRRLVVRHLEAGDADAAARALESMVWDGVLVWDLVDLFELVAARPGQDATLERLLCHYECIGSLEGGARIRKLATRVASNPRERVRWVRELARFRLAHVTAEERPLTGLLAELSADLTGYDDALIAGYRATLARVLPRWRAAPTDAAFDDASEAAWQAIEGLTKIHLRRGNAERAARLLRRGARLPFEHARRRRLLHRAAVLYADRVRDEAVAMRLFKQIFDDGDDDEIARSSFDRFRALLAAGKHDATLAWLLEKRGRRAARAGDSASARAHLERAGGLWERAGEPARACEAYAVGGELGSERSLEALARIHRARKNWKLAAVALEHLAARSAAHKQRHALPLAEARLALGELDRARSAVGDVLREPANADEAKAARRLLLRIHRQAGSFRAVAAMLEEDAERERGPRAAALLCEAATLRRTELGEPREAMRLLERARRADPTHPAVHPLLAEALAGFEMWDALIEVLGEHVSVHGHRRGAELLDVRMRLITALAGRGRMADALEQLHFAVKLDPSDSSLLHARARLERATGDLDAAERTLRAALVAGKSSSEPRGARRRIEINVDLSAIAIEKGDRVRAARHAKLALELAIEEGIDPVAIEPILQSLGEHELLARALEESSRRAPSLFDRLSALESLVETWAGPLGADAELAERLHRLLDEALAQARAALTETGPTSARVAAALVRMLERMGRVADAANVLEQRWRGLAPSHPEFLGLSWELGRVLERAPRPWEARAVYESMFDALASRAPDAEVLRAVGARLEALGSERLADCLERLATLEPKSAGPLVRRLVELRTAQGDERGLVRALGKAARAAPRDRALLWRLADAHRRAGLDAESLGPIDAALRGAPEDVELRLLRARVRERIDDVDGALEDLGTAVATDPHAAALAVPIVRRVLHRAEDRAANDNALVAADLLCRLGLPSEAESALEVVLARSPTDIGALQRLAASAVLREDWERAADLYGRLVELVDLPADDPASGGLAVAFADACLRAGRPADARDALERAVLRRPEAGTVAWHLEQVCEAIGAWQRLSELLVLRARRVTDPEKKVRLLLRAAAVLVERAGAVGEALQLLWQVRVEFPERIEVALACAKALGALGRAREGLALLTPALGRAEGESAALRAEILLEIGKAHLALENEVDAFENLQAGFAVHTRNRELAMLLGVVAHHLGDAATAERALKSALDLASHEDGQADLARDDVDTSLAIRILASIAEEGGARESSAPRRLSGIEQRAAVPKLHTR